MTPRPFKQWPASRGSARRHISCLGRQRGQALIYALFMLTGGLAMLFFVFNTGQLTAEKTKLVNTADAVAYSAGVMHARALNFDAYTNRALMANEVLIAQSVSIASWSRHVVIHTQNVHPLLCRTYYSRPVALTLLEYIPVCYLLSLPAATSTASSINSAVQAAAQATVSLSELAKSTLKGAQSSMAATFIPSRTTLLEQVARANYPGQGAVHVDKLPLTDHFTSFEGKPFIRAYSGAARTRFKEAVVEAAYKDPFVAERSWTSDNHRACISGSKAEYRRRGGTEMNGLDEWRAEDTASLHEFTWNFHGLRKPTCDDEETELGYASRAAAKGRPSRTSGGYGESPRDNPDASAAAGSNSAWNYSGLPTYYELSEPALAAIAGGAPRLRFAVRLTRGREVLRTSEGTSPVKPMGRLTAGATHLKNEVIAAVATSEVFFRRPEARADGKSELASLFNPYWETRLVSTSSADVAQARARGGPL